MRDIRTAIRKDATALGFAVCRFTGAELPARIGDRLGEAVGAGHHATMDWLADTFDRRRSPRAMWPQARSAVLLGMNYGPHEDPLKNLANPGLATISVYARNRDYHDLIKGRLKQIAQKLASRTASNVKVFVDTAPLMEKPLAEQAGLGWQGKHTNLVSRQLGSWLFLGAILTDVEIQPDEPEADHCGNCRACLDICPTNAFPAPYRLDARRCISYLTIEHRGPVPHGFRKAMANRIYGCDDCLAVCPWNKFAQITAEAKLRARPDLVSPELADLVRLDDQAFRQTFSGSPIKRIGRDRFIRNVLIAIGNSGDGALAGRAAALLDDQSGLVRGAAVWAVSQLLGPDEFKVLGNMRLPAEMDADVRREWHEALQETETAT